MPRTVRSPYDDNKDWLDDSREQAASGGSGILHQATVTLDNDEIQAGPSSAPQIIPAPGSGKLILMQQVMLYKQFAVAYGQIANDAYMTPVIGDDDLECLEQCSNVVGATDVLTGFLDDGEAFYWFRYQSPMLFDGENLLPYKSPEIFSANTIGQAAFLYFDNSSSGNFNGGDSANRLLVSAAYYILNTVTGEFE